MVRNPGNFSGGAGAAALSMMRNMAKLNCPMRSSGIVPLKLVQDLVQYTNVLHRKKPLKRQA
jgi:hypothetical protein